MPLDHAITVCRARENNLRNVSLRIPTDKLTVFTGVSGSGKSSLVFGTIAAESQRQLNDTYSNYLRHRLPHYGKPDVDEISNLSVAVIVDQKRIGGNARSTVGTITDINPLLRLLFSRVGEPFAGYANAFSFNNPQGMCPRCEGLGRVDTVNFEKIVDREKSLNEGAICFPAFEVGGWRWTRYVHSGLFDNDKKLKDFTAEEWHNLLYADGIALANPSPEWHKTAKYEGLVPRFTRSFLKRESREGDGKLREAIGQAVVRAPCPECHGARLNAAVLACKINGRSIADCCAMQTGALAAFLHEVGGGSGTSPAAAIVEALTESLGHLEMIGLGYLSLDRETSTLSGGESQRVKMVRHLGSSLTRLTYIFDEPSVGLHPADVDKLNALLGQLRDKGNTVLVVEHDPDVIMIADHIVDMGPKAGACGGEVVYEGDFAGLLASGTLTGDYLSKKPVLNRWPRRPSGQYRIADAAVHNLKNVTVTIPQGVLCVVTGVAGSGKSSLINFALADAYPDMVKVDQGELRGSRRSSIATYMGVADAIRKLFARDNRVGASLFSANSKGACPACKGLGEIRTDLAFMDDVAAPCENCGGTGFRDEALRYRYNGKTIHEVMSLTVVEALEFFDGDGVCAPLRRLMDVGLGYLTLGQPLGTFSGGERQRVKLAEELGSSGNAYIFDEPTSGLHGSDIAVLKAMFATLTGNGNSVIVIEHNLDMIAGADWIIDMGPGAGADGGRVLFTGTPEDLLQSGTATGTALARYLEHDHYFTGAGPDAAP